MAKARFSRPAELGIRDVGLLSGSDAAPAERPAAMNLADNGLLPASITFKIYGFLNGLRSLLPATITVSKTT